MVASVEEETAGVNSLRGILEELPKIDAAIVGEPTQMELAVAEKGLLVFDGYIEGTPGHAAHPNNDNPLYKIPEVIQWIEKCNFDKVSPLLGPVKITLTQINAGVQHNVIPAQVHFVLDVRVNDCYSNKEIVSYLQENAPCSLQARSTHLNSSSISDQHPLVQSGIKLGRSTYGSPTLSDMAALSCPAIKMGPGKSERSHQADEFILVAEIQQALPIYIQLIQNLSI
jgi:acetylornithine deacetylase